MKFKELLKEPKHNYTYKKIPVDTAIWGTDSSLPLERLQQGYFDMVLYDNGKAVIRLGCRESNDKDIDRMAKIVEDRFFEKMDAYIENHLHTTFLQRWLESKNSIRQDDEIPYEIFGKEID